ncbi:MAG: hypothetical protein VKJ02_17275 [Snowella sp.]|nr:hypothetical protein [Snowella sp.]
MEMKPKIQDPIQKKKVELLRLVCSEMRRLDPKQASNLFVCLYCEHEVNSGQECPCCKTQEFVVPDNRLSQQYLNSQNQDDRMKELVKNSLMMKINNDSK